MVIPGEVRRPGFSIYLRLKVVLQERKGKSPCPGPPGTNGHLGSARACSESDVSFFPLEGFWALTHN